MKRIRLVVAYDGTAYCGWQIQANGRTVEEMLNKALSRITGEDIHVQGASRTDAGVHALGNIAIFDTDTKIPPEKILVIFDDISLPVGRIRLRAEGSAGGHNGLKSIIQHLGTDQFPRLRVGVGQKPHPDYDLADWVLGKFQGEDKTAMDHAVKRAADAVECILKEGAYQAMNRFNG